MSKRRWFVPVVLGLFLPFVPPSAGSSADDDDKGDDGTVTVASTATSADSGAQAAKEPVLFQRVRVLGSPETIDRIPGSVTYVDRQELARHDYADVHRILRLVPGVNIQEEDGYGLRPNIGMRGSGVERSSKITTLEDGVLIAPAPYSAPSAYYFPTAGRMEGIEVVKGPGSIRNGPYTNGGVLNFVSTSIPSEFGGTVNLGLGDNETVRGRFNLGDSGDRFGWLFETYQFDTGGFKHLDGGGETGFDLEDYLVKLRLNSAPGAAVYQALELKAGKTEQFGRETYLGLTEADFAVDPFRRYAGSQADSIATDHEQLQLRYLARPNDTVDLTATLYRNDFFRNWHKLQSVGGAGIGSVLDDPTTYAAELAVLRGTPDQNGTSIPLAVRNNRRDYYSQGAQFSVGLTPGNTHDVEIGVRVHEDEEDRFQEDDTYFMTTGGEMVLDSLGAPGSQSNRVSSATSLALYVQDTISLGNWTIVPGVRFETIDFERVDYDDPARSVVGGRRSSTLDEVIPGVGASYRLGTGDTVFAGIHRGLSPPGPSATSSDAERSVNYELGYRGGRGALTFSTIGFFNDYDNLLGACTVSSGCSAADVGDVFDGGEVEVLGVELELGYDLAHRRDLGVRLPVSLTYTATDAEFETSFETDYDAWGSVVAGDELPYLPEQQATVSLGVVDDRWSVYGNVSLVDAMRTVAGQGPLAREESTDSHVLVDLSASFEVRKKLELFVQGRNLLDREYVAARRPAGARPGIDRTVLAGVRLAF